MKIHVAMAATVAAGQLFAGAAHGESLVHEPRNLSTDVAVVSAVPNGMIDCPGSLLNSPKEFEQQRRSTLALQDGDRIVQIAVLAVPESEAQCAVQTLPDSRALSPREFGALTGPATAATGSRLASDSKVGFGGESASTSAALVTSSGRAQVSSVYAGRCGTPNATLLGNAFYVGPYLALSSGLVVPENTDVCLVDAVPLEAPIYRDVFDIRRTSDTGDKQLVGLSLMRTGPSYSGGIVVQTGPLYGSAGASVGLEVDSSDGYQAGPANAYDDQYATFVGPTTTQPYNPVLFPAGGPAWVNVDPPNAPIPYPVGVQVGNLTTTVQNTGGGFWSTTVYPKFHRFQQSDQQAYAQWVSSAAPPTGKTISITGITQGQTVDSNQSLNFGVTASATYDVTLDGKPAASPLKGLSEGIHVLVAYNVSEPKYRHTLSFRAVKQTINPDAYEPDNTRETFKTLFEGSPHSGNFHNASDVDWTAYAVPANVKSTVTLTGSVANNASLKLYRQLNYPTGSIDPIATKINTKNQLVLTDTSGNVAQTVYYVEAKPTSASGSGPNSTYTISVVSELQADAYEYDDTRNAFKTLFEDQPHAGNFHKALDSDWTAYSVGPGTRSTVTLTGAAAQNASLTLYRQLNYPNGSIDPVATTSNQANQLVVADTSGADTLTVYYVEARSTSSAASFKPATYSINVTTQLQPDAYETDDSREQYHALYSGSPQVHNFHNTTDQDWTAYALGPNTHSRVDLTGQVAAASRLELYRQDDYPNGPIVPVATNAEQAGTLSVEDTTPSNVALSVYWVRAMPSNGNPLATKANYTISVQ